MPAAGSQAGLVLGWPLRSVPRGSSVSSVRQHPLPRRGRVVASTVQTTLVRPLASRAPSVLRPGRCEHVSAAGLPGPAAILCLALAELPSGLPPRARASRRLRDLAGSCYFPPSPVAVLGSMGWCLIVGSGH